MATQTLPELGSLEPNQHGYREFTLGKFTFNRDEYFAHIAWPKGTHMIPADAFLRAMQRDVAWGFFYGIVNFDAVVGTVNHYGNVDLYAGRFNEHYRKAGRDYVENFPAELITRVFQAILEDWTNDGIRSLRGAAGDRARRSGPRTAATRKRSRGTA